MKMRVGLLSPASEPLFKREKHSKPQVKPVKGGDIKTLLSFVNIAKEEEELLFWYT